jgi:chromosome condensin MukBEF ATPase and DNA-binding subunit MukB
MNQLSSNVNRPARNNQRLEKLEAEYQQNQERIRQLHRRNRDLADRIREFQPEGTLTTNLHPDRPVTRPRKRRSLARLVVDRVKSINKTSIGKYSIGFWIKAVIMLMAVAIVCGFLGFIITRLIGLLIGA